MPFKETGRMEERIRMLLEHESGNWSVSELCRRHGVCRDTFYEWCKRKQSGDPEWFRDRSHAPLQCRQTTDKAIAAKVIAARRRFPYMGPRKLLAVLDREAPELAWPAASTIGSILKRAGLVVPVKRRRRPLDQQRSCTPAIEPNDEWSADFKGWFRTRDQQRIDPLTTTDSLSRFLIELRITEPTIEGVRPCFERAFREYGLPLGIRCDNGSPFGSRGAGGLTRLSVWWMKLGIIPIFIHPASPQENGRHERMHRTLKKQTSNPPANNRRQQQARFDAFRRHYNPASEHPSGYVIEEKSDCWAGCDPVGCFGFWRARSAMDWATSLASAARAKSQGPSGKGWIAAIAPASAASRNVLGAIFRRLAALLRLSQGSIPSAAGLNTGMR